MKEDGPSGRAFELLERGFEGSRLAENRRVANGALITAND
jgi:hypothetical protein